MIKGLKRSGYQDEYKEAFKATKEKISFIN